MFVQRPRTIIRPAVASTLLSLMLPADAANLVENFDGAELDANVWESTGAKSVTVADGRLTWNNDGGNWASGDISSAQRFFLPPPGETTTITWTLGPGLITTENGGANSLAQSLRYQLGIHSANETATRKEHWANTTGGTWIDLDNISLANTTGVFGGVYSANDTKQANSNGASVGGATIENWSWQTDTHVFRLELTDTDFAWYNGDKYMAGDFWEVMGIDTEFSNGYRVLALGMNFDSGRGFTSVERIEIQNAFIPSSLVSSFSTSLPTPVSGQTVVLSWRTEPEAKAVIDQGIGSVDEQTIDGVGQLQIPVPSVPVPTAITCTLTVSKGAERVSRTVTLNVSPTPDVVFDDFRDDFDGDTLDLENWEHRGERSFTVADGRITWDANAADWGHGEVDSAKVFPMPAPGNTTTVLWTLGPAEGTVEANDGNSLRPMIGIFNRFENHNWSRQHWQNTTGGIWLDVTSLGNNRTDGVSGDLIYANGTKAVDSNGTQLASFDVPDWNWQTDSHEFSLVISEVDYSWFSGDTLLGTGTFEEAGIDTEFASGFKIMMMAGNWNQGRGLMSLESIEVRNGAATDSFAITGISKETDGFRVTWHSSVGEKYEIHRTENLGTPLRLIGEVTAQSDSTSFRDTDTPTSQAFYSVAIVPE